MLERSFDVDGTTGVVPGLLSLPGLPADILPPLVLIGHGGSGHKGSARCRRLARWFTMRAQLAVLAIDGPWHGDRVEQPLSAAEYQARMGADGIDLVTDRMVEDWWSAVDAVGADGLADTGRLAYVGLSMGTRFGLPLVAAGDDRMRCAVLGKFGLSQTPGMPDGLRSERVIDQARQVTCPVLFHLPWDDELFPHDGQLALFDVLGSTDKHLMAYSGLHGETSDAAVQAWCTFTASRLLGTTPTV